MAPGQRQAGGGRQGGAVAAAAVFHAAGGGVTAAGQHPVSEQLLDVAETVLLHVDVARGVREGERGCAQLQGAARVGRGNRGGRVHMETWLGLKFSYIREEKTKQIKLCMQKVITPGLHDEIKCVFKELGNGGGGVVTCAKVHV